jgi:hypothetical protein
MSHWDDRVKNTPREKPQNSPAKGVDQGHTRPVTAGDGCPVINAPLTRDYLTNYGFTNEL